jgi:hypothetical protein
MTPAPNSRTVRVFLSSTFRDFAGERDLLVKTIFPELRRRCRERQVELVDVDLRWGITEEEAQQGKVLPICLAEIDRSRGRSTNPHPKRPNRRKGQRSTRKNPCSFLRSLDKFLFGFGEHSRLGSARIEEETTFFSF